MDPLCWKGVGDRTFRCGCRKAIAKIDGPQSPVVARDFSDSTEILTVLGRETIAKTGGAFSPVVATDLSDSPKILAVRVRGLYKSRAIRWDPLCRKGFEQ